MILILDFGSQYTQLIARRIRELKVYCEIHPCSLSLTRVRQMAPKAVVLSGGPASCYDEGAPMVDTDLFSLGVPLLGICYGAQLVTKLLGGRVVPAPKREYGRATLSIDASGALFEGFHTGETTPVWMSHGDCVEAIPNGFQVVATSEGSPFAAIEDKRRRIYGVQFHPEVAHTPRGKEILENFVHRIAGCQPQWTMASFLGDSITRIRQQVGNKKVICGLSGGVDSSVTAVLLHRAVGDALSCILVDNGLLRAGEADEVQRVFGDALGLKLRVVDASSRFLDALKGVTDPEQKRKIIGRIFVEVFEEEAHGLGGADFLAQGTLYPDVIESVSFRGPSATIKSHHNVGGLPERMRLSLIEPLRELFKDEVRQLGEELALPHHLLWRQPFPGPGLAVRVLGEVTEPRLEILRRADSIIEEEVRSSGLYEALWQAFGVLLPVRTVGVMGDDRTYENVLAIRAVQSQDGMTADWARLPHDLLGTIASRIVAEVRGINRVVYDITQKPPGTIEWE